jgi:thiol:disulfide interchange protein DsbC
MSLPHRAALWLIASLAATAAVQAETTPPGAVTAPAAIADPAVQSLLPMIVQRLGGTPDDYVLRALPQTDLVEVYSKSNARVAYVDRALRYVFVGTLFDAVEKKNLTEERQHELNRIPLASLPKDRVIRIVKGQGTLHFAAFEDPDCPYCRAMEAKLDQLDDYTLDILLMPLTDLHPKAEAAAKAIWCAADPSQAWHDYMHNGKLPIGPADCATPIAELAKLARSHGINGTPTLIMPDGEIIEGLPDLDALKARLAANPAH